MTTTPTKAENPSADYCSECGAMVSMCDDYCEVTELCSDCFEHIMGEPLEHDAPLAQRSKP